MMKLLSSYLLIKKFVHRFDKEVLIMLLWTRNEHNYGESRINSGGERSLLFIVRKFLVNPAASLLVFLVFRRRI
jgi:hypothetical protein